MIANRKNIDSIRSRLGRHVGAFVVLLLIGATIATAAFVRDRASTDVDRSTRSTARHQLWTCSMHRQVIRDSPGFCPICHMALVPLNTFANPDTAHSKANVVKIDPVVVQQMGLRVAPVERGQLSRVIRAVGTIKEPDPFRHDVNLRVSGWIDALYADVDGMPVTKGMPLFDLYSPELNLAIEELIQARKQRETSDDPSASILYDAAVAKLQRLNVSDEQIADFAKRSAAPRTVPILSPMNGHVARKSVYAGSAVKAGDVVMQIVDRSQMWADLQIYEQDLALVHLGQSVNIHLISQPGTTVTGSVEFIHPHLDMTSRSALVRVALPNADYRLHEGMYVTAQLNSTIAEKAIMVPREAIIDTGTKQIAFLVNADRSFEPRNVKLGSCGANGAVQVLEGLSPGEQVVTSGQFLIDSESRMQEAVQKMLRERLASDNSTTKPSAEFQQHSTAIVAAYLDLAKQLGRKEQTDEPLNIDRLVTEANASISSAPDEELRRIAMSVRDSAQSLSNRKLAEQRIQFVELSAAAIAFADKTTSLPTGTDKLFVLHCPMANDGKGADWLQDNDHVVNPYFAKSMKECGSVTRTIERPQE